MELVIEPKVNRLTLYSNEPGYTRELTMPDGIAIERVLDGRNANPADGDNPPYRLLLIPGATIPAVGIQIANRHGSRRVIRLDPMTGFPRVENAPANP
jgi:hypothetical protein